MDLSRPIAVVAPGLHGGVLTVLVRTDRLLTGRAVASLVRPRASAAGVQRVLEDLVLQGLVMREGAGSAWLYSLNREHLAADAVLSLSQIRDRMVTLLRDEVTSWATQPQSAVVFGSAVRGDGGPDSDIDILLVRPDQRAQPVEIWDQQVERLAERVKTWTGNDADLLELSSQELSSDETRAVLAVARREGILLAGRPLPRRSTAGVEA